jgi:hypothetical protein
LRRFRPEWVDAYCLAVDTAGHDVAALYRNGILVEIIPPASRRLFWQDGSLSVELLDTRDVRVPESIMNAVLQPRSGAA